jgi:hypothetical protein
MACCDFASSRVSAGTNPEKRRLSEQVAHTAAVACGLLQAKLVPSIQIRCRITASLWASTTLAPLAADPLGHVVGASGAAGRQANHGAAKRELMGSGRSAARGQRQYTSWPPLTGISAPVT